jgi:hypothetical protein
MTTIVVTVNHDPGAAALDAAIPVIVSSFLTTACEGIDASLQALGVQGVAITLQSADPQEAVE